MTSLIEHEAVGLQQAVDLYLLEWLCFVALRTANHAIPCG